MPSGAATVTPILGGRYVREDVSMEMMGMQIGGLQILGYDNEKDEYVSIWMDSMSTWPIIARGKANDDGVIDLQGTMIDVAGERSFRMTVESPDENRVRVVMYDTIPPHGEVEMMRIDSERAR